MATREKAYLGDGVYASFDGYQVWLEASDSYGATNRIALEPEVYYELLQYVKNLAHRPVEQPSKLIANAAHSAE